MNPNQDYFSWEHRKSNIDFMNCFDDDSAQNFLTQLRAFSKASEGNQDICIYINSQGGWVTSLLAMIDGMSLCRNDFATVGIGQTASCGAVLLSNGTKGKRYITPNARVLIHQVSGGMWGTNSEIQASAKEIDRLNKLLISMLAKNCGRTVDELEELTKGGDLILNAEEAIEFGIVDAILTRDLIEKINSDEEVDVNDADAEGTDAGITQKIHTKNAGNYEVTALALEIKAMTEDEGFYYIEGIASTPSVDRVNDIVEPQCLLDSIKRMGELPAFVHQHNLRDMPLGITTDVYKQGDNTMVKLKMPKDDYSSKIKSRAEMGAYKGLSIGYIPTKFYTNGEGVRVITELDWYEVSLVTIPANPNSKLIQVKNANKHKNQKYDSIEGIKSIREVEKYLVSNGIPKNEALYLIKVVKNADASKGEPEADEINPKVDAQSQGESENDATTDKANQLTAEQVEALNSIKTAFESFGKKK